MVDNPDLCEEMPAACSATQDNHCGICGAIGYGHTTNPITGEGHGNNWICPDCFYQNEGWCTACRFCGCAGDELAAVSQRKDIYKSLGLVCSKFSTANSAASEVRLHRNVLPAGLLSALLLVLAMLIVEVGTYFYAALTEYPYKHYIIVSELANGLIVMLFAMVNLKVLLPQLRLASVRLRWLLPSVLLTPILTVFLARLQEKIFPITDMKVYSSEFLDAGFGWLTIFVCIAILPPLIEEIAYRGILQKHLSRVMSPAAAIGSSAALFAIAHYNIWGIISYLLPFGLIVGWIAYRSGSLWPGIVIHFLHNATVIWTEAKGEV